MRSDVTYKQAIDRACEVLRFEPFGGHDYLTTTHQTFVHAWSDGYYPPSTMEQIKVETTVYSAGSLLLSGQLNSTLIDCAIQAISSIEHKSYVTDTLVNLFHKMGVDRANLALEMEKALGRNLIKTHPTFLRQPNFQNNSTFLSNSPEDRRRIFTQWLDFLPSSNVIVAARILFGMDPDRFTSMLAIEKEPFRIFQMLASLPIDNALQLSTKSSSTLFREIALVRVTTETNEPVSEQAVVDCLNVSLSCFREWSDHVITFLAWPLYPGHDRLMRPYGQALAKADDKFIEQTLLSIPLNLPSKGARLRFQFILEGIEMSGGKVALNRFSAKCFKRWEKWLTEEAEITTHPPQSWIDVAVEEHIRVAMTSQERQTVISEIKREVTSKDSRHYSSALSLRAMHYRQLASYQPYIRVESSPENNISCEDLQLELSLIDSEDRTYYELRYDYKYALSSWERSFNPQV